MIHYHGTPVTPIYDAARFFRAKHAMISYATIDRGGKDQMPLIASVCQSFALDNGAFTAWKSGNPVTDWKPFYEWVEQWIMHPAFDWALIPDVIDGDEAANDALVEAWPWDFDTGVPVWHMHESIDRLVRLCTFWPRVALGSSGEFATVGTDAWWYRMAEAMEAICFDSGGGDGFPMTKLHGLRMLNADVIAEVPLASADSTNIAQNVGRDARWSGRYAPRSEDVRALVMADRIETAEAAAKWSRRVPVTARLFTLAGSTLRKDGTSDE